MPTRYDVIIIGTGQSGPPLAQAISEEGRSVAIIERKRFGGTCVNTGCIPTRTLVASARTAWVARRAAEFGVEISGTVSVDMKKVRARKDAVAGKSETSVHKSMVDLKGCRVIEGHARFTGPHTVEVNGETLEAPGNFHRHGRAGRHAGHSWFGPGSLPDQLRYGGCRLPSGAFADPGGQLHRA